MNWLVIGFRDCAAVCPISLAGDVGLSRDATDLAVPAKNQREVHAPNT